MARGGLDRACRKAAGHTLLVVFHVISSSAVHPLKLITDPRVRYSMAAGLTQREIELARRLADNLADTADTVRRLGWRLLS